MYPVPTIEQLMMTLKKIVIDYPRPFTSKRLRDDIARSLFPSRARKITKQTWAKTDAGQTIYRCVMNFIKMSKFLTQHRQSGTILFFEYHGDATDPAFDAITRCEHTFHERVHYEPNLTLSISLTGDQQTTSTSLLPWQVRWLKTLTNNKSQFIRQYLEHWLTFWEGLSPPTAEDMNNPNQNQIVTFNLTKKQIQRADELVRKKIFNSRAQVILMLINTMYQDEYFDTKPN